MRARSCAVFGLRWNTATKKQDRGGGAPAPLPRSRSATRLKPNASCTQLIGPSSSDLHSPCGTLACSGVQIGCVPANREDGVCSSTWLAALLFLGESRLQRGAEDIMSSVDCERRARARLEQLSQAPSAKSERSGARTRGITPAVKSAGSGRVSGGAWTIIRRPCLRSSASVAVAASTCRRPRWTNIPPGSRRLAFAAALRERTRPANPLGVPHLLALARRPRERGPRAARGR